MIWTRLGRFLSALWPTSSPTGPRTLAQWGADLRNLRQRVAADERLRKRLLTDLPRLVACVARRRAYLLDQHIDPESRALAEQHLVISPDGDRGETDHWFLLWALLIDLSIGVTGLAEPWDEGSKGALAKLLVIIDELMAGLGARQREVVLRILQGYSRKQIESEIGARGREAGIAVHEVYIELFGVLKPVVAQEQVPAENPVGNSLQPFSPAP